jgi:hypothetical protein
MSFFGYQPPPPPPEAPPPEMKIPPDRIIIDGKQFVNEVSDDPEIPMGRFDIGHGMSKQWRPLNYNPQTGELIPWE